MVNAEQEIERLERLVYIPGVWRCAKCGFRLVQSNLNAHDGTVTARDDPGEKCPNDGSPLWRVTYKDDLAEAYERWEEQVARAVAAESKLAEAERAFATITSLQADLDAARELLQDICSEGDELDRTSMPAIRRADDFLARTTLTNLEAQKES